MKELRCPKCGSVFQVDEADYASILSQVKNTEFEAEIERRLKEMEARQQAELLLKSTQARQEFESRMNKKNLELSAKETEISRLKSDMQAMLAKLNGEKNQEIIRLKNQLENISTQKDAERQLALAEKDKAISKLKADMELERYKAQVETEELNKRHLLELQTKQEQIDYYKDLKTRRWRYIAPRSSTNSCAPLCPLPILRRIMRWQTGPRAISSSVIRWTGWNTCPLCSR